MGRSRKPRAFRAAVPAMVAACTAIALVVLPGLTVGGGSARTAQAAAASASAAPKALCTVRDERLTELSGLAADASQWYAIADGGSSLKVYVLDRSCTVRNVITGAIDPYDVEDLALANDGTLWLADTGDNSAERDTVAVHTLRPDGTARLHRLTYPDGKHDAEALLLGPSGVPHIVTKNVLGTAKVYRPDARLRSPGPTPLVKVAEVDIPSSDTPGGPVGGASSALVTGGAVNADGSVIALRTYTDAYLFPAPNGHLVEALERDPVRIPLPNEPQGEAIAFTPDGTLLSAGEGGGLPIRAVPGAVAKAHAAAARSEAGNGEPGPGQPAAAGADERRAADEAGLAPVPGFIVAASVVGLVYAGWSWYRRRV
ncbi:esterase-like activity of phytase family protein [Haloechinothrix halophila]|uniref:esterase-like activity of phytase family protein n=1 Tax=Haloechinothrix halophila TaxID=1069073 RepID=UPI0003F7C095|nr:esterase-like activity of phytase family protein [Haloechinothrix halophila]